ncbi:hypothetical protein HYE67_005153 [Fusarium culmorum]|uniref:Uncharacterized protein n=1 Tax=Fusarium culmorum TaxID=5516 RepID=A0A7S8HVG1_FUSCU|nr:hypothetical protein HYE67_005153 [Fusarium culmorum]
MSLQRISLFDVNILQPVKGLRFSPSSPKPADLWDQHGQSVITSNSEHFTGFLNFKISCLRGDTSAADRFIVVCGLTADLSDDLRPWMAIYDARDSGVSCSDSVAKVVRSAGG